MSGTFSITLTLSVSFRLLTPKNKCSDEDSSANNLIEDHGLNHAEVHIYFLILLLNNNLFIICSFYVVDEVVLIELCGTKLALRLLK